MLCPHISLVLKHKKKAMPHGVACNAVPDLLNIVFDHLTAILVFLLLREAAHLLHIRLGIRRQRACHHLQIVRRDLEIGGKSGNNILPVIG